MFSSQKTLEQYVICCAQAKWQHDEKQSSEKYANVRGYDVGFPGKIAGMVVEAVRDKKIRGGMDYKRRADIAPTLIFSRIRHDVQTVGPDTHLAGYAGDAKCLYIETDDALSLARDKDQLVRLINEHGSG